MSPFGLVLSVPLSTALRPLTPLAPFGLRLIRSHPDPSGAQLTDGGAGSGPVLETIGDGSMCASAEGFASFAAAALRTAASASAALAAAVALADPTAKDAVDGETNGPVSRLQPLAQPVAAGPVKVGENVPRLEEVTLEPWGVAILADAAGETAANIAIGRPKPRRAADKRWRFFLLNSTV